MIHIFTERENNLKQNILFGVNLFPNKLSIFVHIKFYNSSKSTMQERHQNRRQYFKELAETSEKYYIPYIESFAEIDWQQARVLEIGCGEGGNLLPFARRGSIVYGVDMAEGRIKQALEFFHEEGEEGVFISSDIFALKELQYKFDLILLHDVIEHIADKQGFMQKVSQYLASDGILFVGFPAWQMPFGGHQQIARNKIISHFPFIHLLPRILYKNLLQIAGEIDTKIAELLDIKQTGTTVEMFQKLIIECGYETIDRRLYFINPHYEAKFGMKPRCLWSVLAAIPYVRNFFSTSCFFLLKRKDNR